MAIGETVLGAVLQVAFDRLASPAVINFFRSSKLDQSLVHNLKNLMLAAEKLMLDAEDKQFTDRVVKQWLDELKHWFYRAEEIVDEIATEALRSSIESPPHVSQSFQTKVRNMIPGSSSTSSFQSRVTDQIKHVTGMLESMLSQKEALGLREISVASATSPLTHRVPTTCLMEDSRVFGRDQDRENILEFLQSDTNETNGIGVIAIVGMGGLGKTTLAKMVFNDSSLDGIFDIKVWVCVSDQFDVSRVTKSVLESILGHPYSGSPDLNFLQLKLSGELREKRFLVVLDDVWNEDYQSWECLCAPFSVGAKGSKIIVTTRNDGVASIMRTAPVFKLKTLLDEDGWFLFSRHAFDEGSSIANPSLELIGRELVKKCRGLPLAIKTLAGLLRYKQDICEWEAILDNKLWDLPCDKTNLIPSLRLSYYYLPSHLKRCFSYCALFPKDYSIDRKQLVLLWMAENYVVLTDNQRRIEDVADEYVQQLLSRSLLEASNESGIRMHDLVYDLAEAVLGDLLTRHELNYPSKFSNNARYFSYISDEYDGITKFQAIHESKYMRTFMTLPNSQLSDKFPCYMSNWVPMVLVPQFSYLRVLSLSKYDNVLLSESIGNLKQLRYLDISKAKIKRLPESVSTLYNLQTLILSKCTCLASLPEDLWRLSLLRHLDLTETTSLLQMPRQMGKLKSLQTLTAFVVGKGTGSTIQELNKLLHIHGKLALRRLQNVTNPGDAFDANLKERECLQELALEFDREDNDGSERARVMLKNLRPHDNLERLTIRNYFGTTFPSWLDHLRNMTTLSLSGCLYCHSLPPLGQLPFLKELEIEEMEYIISVGPEFYGHKSALSNPFPALSSLSFKKMKGWKVWSNIDTKGNAVWFPCLQKLSLHDCPKLAGNLPIHMPFLETLWIHKCEQLNGLLPRVPSIHPLEVAACPRADLASALDLTTITKLKLRGLVQVVMLPLEIIRLSSLKDLTVEYCKNLKSLANVRLPAIFDSLQIDQCRALEFLPEGLQRLTHLQNINLIECPCLKWVQGDSLPTSLQVLSVRQCQRLEIPISSERMHEYTSLERMYLAHTCRQLVSFPLGLFPNLRFLVFRSLKDLENVYIPQPEEIGSNSLVALDILIIEECPKLKMVGKATGSGEATILHAPNLKDLEISNCKNARPVLIQTEEEVLLPQLCNLIIENMDEMLYWGTPKISLLRFSHLVYLEIKHDSNAESYPDGTLGSLPASLKELHIIDFPKLRKLDGKALQSLTSLQCLWILDCPQLQGLPEEGLPPSLGYLDISGCPLLEERCQPEKGQDWSKISHIPCVYINGHCITGP